MEFLTQYDTPGLSVCDKRCLVKVWAEFGEDRMASLFALAMHMYAGTVRRGLEWT